MRCSEITKTAPLSIDVNFEAAHAYREAPALRRQRSHVRIVSGAPVFGPSYHRCPQNVRATCSRDVLTAVAAHTVGGRDESGARKPLAQVSHGFAAPANTVRDRRAFGIRRPPAARTLRAIAKTRYQAYDARNRLIGSFKSRADALAALDGSAL
jgi:hypothetical protein